MNLRNKMLISLSELSIHFLYLVLFYLISVFYGKDNYFPELMKSTFNDETTRNLLTSVLVTFSFIGVVYCLAVVFSKEIKKSDGLYTEIIFKFGIDYLYFIVITIATLSSIVFFLLLKENLQIFQSIFNMLGAFLISYVLRLIHHNFDGSSIHRSTD